MKKLIAFLLALTILSGCAVVGTQASPAAESTLDFAVNLLRETTEEGENTLISPLSVLTALAMTANGAEGETLTQMEQVLGGTRDVLNQWLKSFGSDETLKMANGIWLKDDEKFKPHQDFLDRAKKVYDAQIETAHFDEATQKEINDWVNKKTDGMISKIIDEIPEEAVLYLVNALAFDAEWSEPYADYQVQEEEFTTEDGEKQTVEMMYDAVADYLRTENAQGFLKWYEGERYAFAALLPDEGVGVQELLDSLTGEKLASLLSKPEETLVQTAIPKFESGSHLELRKALDDMGMENAFDGELADFSAIGRYEDANLCISRVLHKTYIAVTERGTRAGAATAVELEAGGTMAEPTTVYLNRPFVYMIVDMEQQLPIFMGTCMEVND